MSDSVRVSADVLLSILSSMNIRCERDNIRPFKSAEDGSEYCVWKVCADKETYVLKRAKGYEAEVYSSFFRGKVSSVPTLVATACVNGSTYMLTEYIDGRDMCRCDRTSLLMVLDALIRLQEKYWNNTDRADAAFSFDKSFKHRAERGDHLNDSELERAYSEFLGVYKSVPRTLCHDDLLPFNVLISENRAALIDWEIAGILPYPTSLARLIAHCEESEDAFFFMKNDDRHLAINYYYDNLIRSKGISYEEYIYTLNLFIFYEYCEWIMLGIKYDDADMNRYEKYLNKAKKLLNSIYKQGDAI